MLSQTASVQSSTSGGSGIKASPADRQRNSTNEKTKKQALSPKMSKSVPLVDRDSPAGLFDAWARCSSVESQRKPP